MRNGPCARDRACNACGQTSLRSYRVRTRRHQLPHLADVSCARHALQPVPTAAITGRPVIATTGASVGLEGGGTAGGLGDLGSLQRGLVEATVLGPPRLALGGEGVDRVVVLVGPGEGLGV